MFFVSVINCMSVSCQAEVILWHETSLIRLSNCKVNLNFENLKRSVAKILKKSVNCMLDRSPFEFVWF